MGGMAQGALYAQAIWRMVVGLQVEGRSPMKRPAAGRVEDEALSPSIMRMAVLIPSSAAYMCTCTIRVIFHQVYYLIYFCK